MILKTIAIVFILSVCVQCVLCADKPEAKRRHRRRIVVQPSSKRTQSISEPDIKNKTTISTNKSSQQEGEKPETIIKGEKGVIEVDGKIVQANDKTFKDGSISVRIVQARIYINNNLIFEGKPTDPDSFTKSTFSSSAKSFKIEIFSGGRLVYTDSSGTISRVTF